MICLSCNAETNITIDDFINQEEIRCSCGSIFKINCDYCKWGGLFHCTHPQHYIKDFRLNESCNLFQWLPNNEKRARVHWNYKCSKCKKEKPLDELASAGKGSTFICKECRDNHNV
jgi:hypothetical protein